MAEEKQDAGVEIQDFILSRELAEVYLLMDHISACECKEIPSSINADPIFKNGGKTWLEQICEIAWPPETEDRARDASNAAKLIRAKDVLNKAASPATGGTIAFTLMMAGEAREPRSGSWWKRTLMWMADVSPNDPSDPGGGGGGGNRAGGPGWPGGKPPSRASLAALAYPSLSRRAWQYRLALYFLLVFLVLWLLATCVLSWDVATGNSLLNQVTTAEARIVTLQGSTTPDEREEAATPDGAGAAPPSAEGENVAPSSNSAAPPTQPSAAENVPDELGRTLQVRVTASENLANWMSSGWFIRRWPVNLMGGSSAKNLVTQPTAAGAASTNPPPSGMTNTEWAAAMLGVLASNILPIFYGLLGAGAAVVRGVSVKMRESLLSPRDILLAYVQLALGAVIGACIGLFVNSEGDAGATEGGLLGSVPLSASALCFVAGFGVEGVFQALESLIRRVFNLDNPPRPSSTT